MKKSHMFLIIMVLFLNLASVASAYKPGDTLTFKYPESGPTISLPNIKPKFVRWTLFDPKGNVVFEEDHELTYRADIGFPPLASIWVWYDEYSIRVPSFAEPGTWKITGNLHNEMLFVIELPELLPYEKEFEVEQTSFWENLLAPWYFTYDGGIMMGRISGSLPVHPYLIFILIGVIVGLILLVKIFINILVPYNGGRKHEKKTNHEK